ncbi:SURF1 family protein [Oxalobacteraceae bacterium]|nr:SURF1 family protein [Oxalobacteraceae bacterium]
MFFIGAGLMLAGFLALGTWQVKRLQWKLDLIDRVEQRVHAQPVTAPGPASWPSLNAAADEYRHVRLRGTLLTDYTTRVQATTGLGSGYWLLAPLCGADGSITLINRGFVAANTPAPKPLRGGAEACRAAVDELSGIVSKRQPAPAPVDIVGLLRISEGNSGFLRKNDAGAERWVARNVAAIAAARGLGGNVAPYFVDVERPDCSAHAKTQGVTPGSDPTGLTPASASGFCQQLPPDVKDAQPTPGLTIISFTNNHLVYAITWYALALMMGGAIWWVRRSDRQAPDADGSD